MSDKPEENMNLSPEQENQEIDPETAIQEEDPSPAETDVAEGTVDTKIQAIKAALLENEQLQQQQELQMQIAEKVKKLKSGKTEPAESNKTDHKSEKKADDPIRKEKKKKNGRKSSKKKKKKKNSGLFLPRRGDSFLEVFRKIVFLSSSAVFIVCLGLIGNYFWENHQNAMLMDEMQSLYVDDPAEDPTEDMQTSTEQEVYEYYGLMASAKNLLEVNPDVVGWISIPDTKISYPVLQRKHPDPDETEPNDYYLTRNIRNEETRAGSIFLDYRANFDYVENNRLVAPNSGNLVIYGHNMRDYSMFGSLKEYVNTAGYYENHPIVEFNSNYRKYVFKIFAMIIVDIDDQTETRFDYWNKLDFADEADYYDFVNEIKRRTIRTTEVDVQYGDQLLALSTCNGTFEQGRLVLFARAVREGEDPFAGTQNCEKNPNIKWCSSYYKWNGGTYDPNAFVPYG